MYYAKDINKFIYFVTDTNLNATGTIIIVVIKKDNMNYRTVVRGR